MPDISGIWEAIKRGLGGGTKQQKLGAFIGVFTPSILTILGVILYLRTGWVVGSVGLLQALLIVVIANTVTLVSALSISAIASNMKVGAGGGYYIISRSLGIEIGAAIGIPLYLAMTLSVTLYAFGLAESMGVVWDDVPQRPVAALTVLAVALLAAKGAGVALKLQLPIMAGIVLSLVALFAGAFGSSTDTVSLMGSAVGGASFWEVFAVFFPAVTGIMAGVSLSGDLKRPSRAIPRGTIAAVLTGFVVYMIVPVVLAVSATPEELVSNNLIWFDIAGSWSFLVLWGLWGAIFASAVGSILAAPRTLEAMVDDRVLPSPLGVRLGRIDGPGVPLLVSTALALVAVALGDLDAIAPLLTMFFLTTYGTVNLVAGIEQLSGDPSYRPTFRIPWWISLAAALACFYVMYLINPIALVVAVVFEFGVYVFMRRRAMTAPWGDLRRGALMSLVRSTVIRLAKMPADPRNWRPNILLFAGDLDRNPDLARFAGWLVQDRGILTVAKLVRGPIRELSTERAEQVAALARQLEDLSVIGFAEVDIVDDFVNGAVSIAQSNGIAGIDSNTVMFGWADGEERQAEILRIVERLSYLGKSAVICRPVPRGWNDGPRQIHVWWGGLKQNGDMLVLFAHLLSLNPTWRNARIVINSIATSEMTYEVNKELLAQLTSAARIDATINVILKPDDASVADVIFEGSRNADVVLLGLRGTEPGEEVAYTRRMASLVEGLPTTLFVRNAGEFQGQLLGATMEGRVERAP
ncbi:MAG: Na-K-Cl cotransporter [Actinomycetia bacterium]|nr:Na-K-Cl cotransporter [Actinomycetes bacterium]